MSQSMGATAVQAGSPALIPEPISKPGRGERLAELRDEEGQVTGPADHGRERFMHGDPNRAPCLLLADRKPPLEHVLATHANHIRAPLPGVEQQCECEARPRTHWMML